jgi:predicted DNA-binding ribbon-helix-helix protein
MTMVNGKHKNFAVDEEVWRQLRIKAIERKVTVTTLLNQVLAEWAAQKEGGND